MGGPLGFGAVGAVAGAAGTDTGFGAAGAGFAGAVAAGAFVAGAAGAVLPAKYLSLSLPM